MVQKFESPYPYTDFIDIFVHPVVTMLLESPPPRISSNIRRILQLSKNHKVGDWYLYQNHTKIRIYGYELPPYKLPNYLPMRLFSLEYFRKMIGLDEVQLLASWKKTQFKMKNQMGPFICNTKEVGPEADKILQQFKFKKSFI